MAKDQRTDCIQNIEISEPINSAKVTIKVELYCGSGGTNNQQIDTGDWH